MSISSRLLCIATLALALGPLASCGGDSGVTPDDGDEIASVSVSPTSTSVAVGATEQLTATVRNKRGETVTPTVTWTSSATGVARVNTAGLVTGVAPGTVVVTASAGGESGDAAVAVTDVDPPAAPTEVTAVAASHDAIDVGWKDNSNNEDEFVIEREVVQSGTSSAGAAFEEVARVGANVKTYRDGGLAPNTTYRYLVRACNENGCLPEGEDGGSAASGAVATHETLVWDGTDPAAGVVGASYSHTFTAEGGNGSYLWSLTGGALPEGLLLSLTGVLSGTPKSPGSYTFTVRVESAEQSVSHQLNLEVAVSAELTVTTANLPPATVGASYSRMLEASGGDGTYAWTLTQGSLPPGLSLNQATGVISGVPTDQGTFGFTVRVTSAGLAATKALSITAISAPVSVDTDYLTPANVGAGFSQTLEASGGDDIGYTFEVVAGALPAGLTLNGSTGALTGTPSVPGVSYFTVRVTSGGATKDKTFAMWVSSRPRSAFNMTIMNVTEGPAIPAANIVSALDQALDKWEQVITGDLSDATFSATQWSEAVCSGHGQKLNGKTVDDMVIMVNLAHIDGPGKTVGSAGPCGLRITSTKKANTSFGRLTLDTSDLDRLSAHQAFSLIFHEIGHIVGLGTVWKPQKNDQTSEDVWTALMTGHGGTDPRYTGAGGNGFYKTQLGGGSSGAATQIPIETDGGEGTRDAHWDEGEFDKEIMTGWIENNGSMAVSGMTIAAVGDMAYTAAASAADSYTMPACAPNCGTSSAPPGVADNGGIALGDDVLDEPMWAVGPDGRTIRLERVQHR